MKQEEIEPFSSKVVHGHTKTVLLDNNMYIMTQAPEKGEEPCLPHGLNVVNTYTEITTGSGFVAIIIKNQTAAPIIIGKGIKVSHMVAGSRVPPVEVMPGTLEKLVKCREFDELRCLLGIGRRCFSSSQIYQDWKGGLE